MSLTMIITATLAFLLIFSFLPTASSSSLESFIYGGCSQLRYSPGSLYQSNLNSLLTSLVNLATFTNYNNFTLQNPSSYNSQDSTIYGLFQCRGDLSNGDCSSCVATAVSQLGTLCVDSSGGALQLEGCFVKYDNLSFFGVEDKTVVTKKCGPLIGYNSDALTRRDAVLDYLGAPVDGSYYYRTSGGSGDFYGVAQCVQDLSASECQDCLSDAIGRLKTDCQLSASGDMYLAKCYVRYSERGAHSQVGNGDKKNGSDTDKTLAIIIGMIAGVALLILFLSFLGKLCNKEKGSK